ncbi:MAG TPA: TonB-dependent receptor [Polyangiaceae bacterium]|nr:TonB-dependent receptor [Polyangiaceae bacterium]
MNKSRTAATSPKREALSKWRLVSQQGLIALARLAPLLACAGVLTSAAPAGAQAPAEPAPEAAPAAEPAPPPARPEAAAAPEPPAPAGAPPAESPEAAPAVEAGAEVAPEEIETIDDGEIPEVVVTGFRRSLSAALQKKQRSTGQVDAIVADDIADFPDLNLAESLQRIPGIAISRSNTEGSQITVRGLGGLYTRVRLNGMEARASVGNSNFNNTGRGFDFNLFASELFNSIVVHKTASADLEEGSLGSVVDLNTARAFNYDEGFTFVAGATAAYNDLSDTVRPRLTGLIAYRDPAGIWGATASAAYTRVRLDSANTETVGWQRSAFNSVNGVDCQDNVMDPGCLEVADAFHPRIPRFAQNRTTGDRLGLTAGVQFRPGDQTELRLDGLYAMYPNRTDQRRLFVLFRGNEQGMDLRDYVLRPEPARFGVGNSSIIAGTVDHAWVRSEAVRLDAEARFHQLTLALDHRFDEHFFLNAMAGTSRSKAGFPHDTTVNYDNRDYNGYRFDFTNDKAPLLAFQGLDVTDPANFVVPELRDRVGTIEGAFDTLELNLHYSLFEELKFAAGVNFKRTSLENKPSNRDGTLCALGLYECDLDGDMMDDPGVLGPAGDPALSETVNYPGEVGPGSNSRWTSPSIDGWIERLGYYNVPLIQDQNGTNKVIENDLGYYLQARGDIPFGLGEMHLQYDAGVRLVETRQTSSGFNSGVYVTVERPVYRDWLPSANTALWLTGELVARLAAARVMARPGLDQLSPGGNVDPVNYLVNFQNPQLDPTRASTLDAAIEWYFGNESILSLAFFYKDIDSFPIRQSRRGTFASTNLPTSVIIPLSPAAVSPNFEGTCNDPAGCWDISELTNGPGAKIRGLEVGFQAPFSAFYSRLPPVLRDMGVVANYTFVDSSVVYDFLGNPVKERITGLSKGQYNATLYYEDSKFSIRGSLAHRSDFLNTGPNQNENLWQYTEAETRLDASSSYNVTSHLKLSLEALNLTDAAGSSRVDVDAERRNTYARSGRTFLLGARVSY